MPGQKGKKFTFSLTFPDELFRQVTEEELEAKVKAWSIEYCYACIISTEHGTKGGRYHHQGYVEMKNRTVPQNIAKSLRSALDITQDKWSRMSPMIKKRMLVVKNSPSDCIAVNYATKETRGDVSLIGCTSTWINEMKAEGDRQKELVKLKETFFINDTEFREVVREYTVRNHLEHESLCRITYLMDRDGYDFHRVKNMKYHVASWYARYKDNENAWNVWFSAFEPPDIIID